MRRTLVQDSFQDLKSNYHTCEDIIFGKIHGVFEVINSRNMNAFMYFWHISHLIYWLFCEIINFPQMIVFLLLHARSLQQELFLALDFSV